MLHSLAVEDVSRRKGDGLYVPKHFAITDRAVLHDLIDRFSFAALVTVHDGYPVATHLPFIIDPDRGENGTLIAHMARANEQWQDFVAGTKVLVIFQGGHAYVSPSWYQTHPEVPTWDYMVVHAYGVPRIIDGDQQVESILRNLIAKHESGRDQPWQVDVPDEHFRRLMRGVVAFEIPISRLEGKFKLNQNHPAVNREGVIQALTESEYPDVREMAAVMRSSLSLRSVVLPHGDVTKRVLPDP